MVAVSRAPRKKIAAFQKRMGWDFKWLSSHMGSYRVMFRIGKEKIGLIAIHHGARLLDPDKLK